MEIEDKTICVVDVSESDEPVYFDKDEFYVRIGSSSEPLNKEETSEFIDKHF